jgi:predicted RNA binding protein YcfA (HicA-like mRNA interferase family)
MASRSRCSLHLNKLDEFAAFCEADGWKRAPAKGSYEVLRMTKKGKEPLIVHTKNATKEHLTTWGMSAVMLGQWFRNRQPATTPEQTP